MTAILNVLMSVLYYRRNDTAAVSSVGVFGGLYHGTTQFQFSFRDVKNTKFIRYLTAVLTSLNVPISTFQKHIPVIVMCHVMIAYSYHS